MQSFFPNIKGFIILSSEPVKIKFLILFIATIWIIQEYSFTDSYKFPLLFQKYKNPFDPPE